MRLLFERGMRAKPRSYLLQKMFTNEAFTGYAGNHEGMVDHLNDMRLLSNFYKKYPEVKYLPQAS